VPYEDFVRALNEGVFAQMLLVRRADDAIIGVVQGRSASFRHGTCGLGAFVFENARDRVHAIQGVLIFVEYLFHEFTFRKLYAESTQRSFDGFASGLGRLFEIEGELKNHEWHDGAYRSSFIASVTRPAWLGSPTRRRLLAAASTPAMIP